jgi:hypothetical protein
MPQIGNTPPVVLLKVELLKVPVDVKPLVKPVVTKPVVPVVAVAHNGEAPRMQWPREQLGTVQALGPPGVTPGLVQSLSSPAGTGQQPLSASKACCLSLAIATGVAQPLQLRLSVVQSSSKLQLWYGSASFGCKLGEQESVLHPPRSRNITNAGPFVTGGARMGAC